MGHCNFYIGYISSEVGFLMFSWAKKNFQKILEGENIFGID